MTGNDDLLLRGGMVHTCGPDGTLQADVLIKGTRVAQVAPQIEAPGAEVIDVSGKTVTPGFIDAHSHLGAARYGDNDSSDTSAPATPTLQVLDSFDPMDPSISDALFGGVTTVMLHPGSPMSFGQQVETINVIPGQSAIIKTAFEDGRPRVLREPAGVKMALGEHPKRVFDEGDSGPHTRMKMLAIIRQHLLEAADWLAEKQNSEGEGNQSEQDGDGRAAEFQHAALAGLLQGSLSAHVHVHRVKDIRLALNLAEEFGLSVVLEHATEADRVAAGLAEGEVPCVVGPITFSRRGTELANLSLQLPARLAEAGVKFALMTDHPTYPSQHLPLMAGVACREGLSFSEALLSITRYPAEILGIDDRTGSLEAGRDADLVVHSGDPLEADNTICGVMCEGEWEFGYRQEGISYDWIEGRERT